MAHYNRETLIAKLTKLLGAPVVESGFVALPELLKMAAVEVFMNGNDNDLGETTYFVRLALNELREKGQIDFVQP